MSVFQGALWGMGAGLVVVFLVVLFKVVFGRELRYIHVSKLPSDPCGYPDGLYGYYHMYLENLLDQRLIGKIKADDFSLTIFLSAIPVAISVEEIEYLAMFLTQKYPGSKCINEGFGQLRFAPEIEDGHRTDSRQHSIHI